MRIKDVLLISYYKGVILEDNNYFIGINICLSCFYEYVATVLLGLFGNGMVDAFYCCQTRQTPIPLSHFGMEGELSVVCGNGVGPAKPNSA